MLRTLILLSLVILVAAPAFAQEDAKTYHVGLGGYGIVWGEGDESTAFNGGGLCFLTAFNPNMGLRAALYATEHEHISAFTITGVEAQFLYGAGLAAEGFKYYGQAGLFTESFEVEILGVKASEQFKGLMVGGGLGYNWPGVALDFTVNWRQNSDYVDYVESEANGQDVPDVSMASGMLSVAFRF